MEGKGGLELGLDLELENQTWIATPHRPRPLRYLNALYLFAFVGCYDSFVK